jgi:TetR/AcrR family transcriptional regulator, transcriptional repressor for nem operon
MPNAGQLTPKGQRTRERIVEAAADLMLRQGFAATTLDDVKAAAGVGSSQLYHYFDGKADLVQAIIARHTELVVARHETLLRELDTLAALRDWCDFVVGTQRSLECRGGCPIGSLGSEVAEYDEMAREAISASMCRWEAALREGLGRLRDNGALSRDAEPAALALSLIVALQGGLLLGKIHRSPAPLEVALDTALAYVAIFAT